MKKLVTFLIIIIISVSLANSGWVLWKERFDLPQETKELIVGTIKNELSLNAKCVKESCRKEVRNLENVLDEISYANQLGRLDIISLLLAIFGLVLGFGAVVGFMGIKQTSRITAQESATKWLDSKSGKKQIKDSVYDWISSNPKEMDKIVIKAAKAINKEKANSAPKNGISNSSTNEKDLIEAIKEKNEEKYDKETNYILSRIYRFCAC
ncbi:MAG: hypothetical protein FJ368_00595 [Pelagibacterales bacterium]|nr:hypothetical protein [Pelagibacterales bacterium]